MASKYYIAKHKHKEHHNEHNKLKRRGISGHCELCFVMPEMREEPGC
jgi:hypothetical protein